tara:strand:- start:578 stop:1582 length:1005 start_codon:yes stop_codon:yes gene_type:complete
MHHYYRDRKKEIIKHFGSEDNVITAIRNSNIHQLLKTMKNPTDVLDAENRVNEFVINLMEKAVFRNDNNLLLCDYAFILHIVPTMTAADQKDLYLRKDKKKKGDKTQRHIHEFFIHLKKNVDVEEEYGDRIHDIAEMCDIHGMLLPRGSEGKTRIYIRKDFVPSEIDFVYETDDTERFVELKTVRTINFLTYKSSLIKEVVQHERYPLIVNFCLDKRRQGFSRLIEPEDCKIIVIDVAKCLETFTNGPSRVYRARGNGAKIYGDLKSTRIWRKDYLFDKLTTTDFSELDLYQKEDYTYDIFEDEGALIEFKETDINDNVVAFMKEAFVPTKVVA